MDGVQCMTAAIEDKPIQMSNLYTDNNVFQVTLGLYTMYLNWQISPSCGAWFMNVLKVCDKFQDCQKNSWQPSYANTTLTL
jgi:hypothetical protein